MRASIVRSVLPIACVALAACANAIDPGSPRAFNRPSRVTFVCVEGQTPTALTECEPVLVGEALTQRDGFTLIALVPQQTRGEVAAVDLTASPARVLDSDRRVPGYTFVPAGEIPTAIAISPVDPRCTWVANRGSRDLSAIETVRFREESLAMGEIGERFSLLEGTSLTSGRPHAMELVELAGTSELYVTLPEDGVIARVVVSASGTECLFQSIEIIPVPTDIPADPAGAPTDPTLLAPELQDPATLAVCPASAQASVVPAAPAVVLDPVDPIALPAPMPLEMIVERDAAGTPVALLIGDMARPVVHRFDLASRTWLGSLRAAGPVRDLALTPAVPDTLAAGAMTRRYVYAIDDRDGTVFVIDFETGHVLPVGPEVARRPDRLPLDASARAIEVISTDDARRSGAECSVAPASGAFTLNGVFVAVAMSDGTVRIVDVYDLDASCRSGDDCTTRLALTETSAFIGRHRPRLGVIGSPVALEAAPTATVRGGGSLRYEVTGEVPDEPATPEFTEIACPPGLAPVFFTGTAPRLCTVTDPWEAEVERWQIAWQGAIPGSGSSGGTAELLGDGSFAIDTRVDLCSRGVLGADGAAAVPAGQPEAGYAGDAVAITSALPQATEADAACRTLVGLDTSDQPEPVLLPIREVLVTPDGGTRIVIAPDAPVLDRAGVTAQEVIRCFAPMMGTDEPLAFDVRVRDSYVVVGSRSVFRHRVVRTADRCEVDTTIDPRRIGRAFLDRPFVGERLAFLLSYGEGSLRPELTIAFDVADAPVPLFTDLAHPDSSATEVSLPSEIVWNDVDERLYVLDEIRRGLVPVRVDTLSPLRSIE